METMTDDTIANATTTETEFPNTESQAAQGQGKEPSLATARVAAAAHSAIDSFEKSAAPTEQMLRNQTAQLSDRKDAAAQQAQDTVGQVTQSATQFVEEKPVQALAMAFGAGALLALLMRK